LDVASDQNRSSQLKLLSIKEVDQLKFLVAVSPSTYLTNRSGPFSVSWTAGFRHEEVVKICNKSQSPFDKGF
jgi:hypothetical protein